MSPSIPEAPRRSRPRTGHNPELHNHSDNSSGGRIHARDLIGIPELTAASDHGLLLGLADDDHAQYLLLAGRAPSQLIAGATIFTTAPRFDIASAATGFTWTATDIDGNGVWAVVPAAPVSSVFGRTGAVVADAADYAAFYATISHTHTFASLTSKPTTVGGYGITDFVSLGDAEWSQLGHTHTASEITDFVAAGDAEWAQLVHAHSAADITSGLLALARGGSNADLSATGGANQFVRQSSVGGAFAVSAIADADVPDILTISKIGNLTANGFVKTSAADGTLSVDTSAYLTGNQTITISGDVDGSGMTAITVALDSILTAGGPTGSVTSTPIITWDAKGRLTAVSSATITPAWGSITGTPVTLSGYGITGTIAQFNAALSDGDFATGGGTATGTNTGDQTIDAARSWATLQKFPDDMFNVVGSADAAKIMRFEVDGLSVGTRTLTPQDASYTIAGTTLALFGTGKSLTAINGGLVYTDADSMEILAAPAAIGQTLRATSTTAFAWGALDLADTDAVTGLLPIANGGTNSATASAARTALGLAIGTNVQAWDENLDALATLTAASDRLPYFNAIGPAGMALATFTAAGRALIDDADATAQRATLGLVIGTNVQAFHENLAALAAVSAAADRLPYFNASGPAGMGLATFTAAARTLLDDVAVSDMRNTLGATAGVWGVALGGTGLTAGTSGGVLGFTGTTTLASSVALTASALVLGGGAGATPTPMASLGTTTTVLHGNAAGAPTFAAVSLAADVSGDLPFANLAQGSARSVLGVTGNATADFASIQGAANQTLVVNSAGTALTFGTLAVGGGGTGATTFTAGRVLFGNTTSAINTSANLFWDNSNNRLGINAASPAETLAIGYGANTDMAIGSATSNKIYLGTFNDNAALSINRNISTGVFANGSLYHVEVGLSSQFGYISFRTPSAFGIEAMPRRLVGLQEVVANNTYTDIILHTIANNSAIAGSGEYCVEVRDGTNIQVEIGSFQYRAYKLGAAAFVPSLVLISGMQQTCTAGTLTIDFVLDGSGNSIYLYVRSNSTGLGTISAGFPKITFELRNLTQQNVVPA